MTHQPSSATSLKCLLDLRAWCTQPLGLQLAAFEREVLREVLSDIFGYHLVQVGHVGNRDLLSESRILHKTVLGFHDQAARPATGALATRTVVVASSSWVIAGQS